ncbi:MAG: M20/M25/M40 family metallo-hydrolase [Cytophagales bacterium]|nr:M20/M25/M40 family metallo-hydrolase [Cytophagales bacterium]
MKIKHIFLLAFLIGSVFISHAQISNSEEILSKIQNEGYQNSQVLKLSSELVDVYGQRLTGSREYLKAAQWMRNKMEALGIENAHLENYCENCRGWSINSFNVELVAPNYMHINAYPLAMARSTDGIVEGEIVHIPTFGDMDLIKEQFSGNLRGKIILMGSQPKLGLPKRSTSTGLTVDRLQAMDEQLVAKNKQTPLPELLKSWESWDMEIHKFLQFVDEEGALAVLKTKPNLLNGLRSDGTYLYWNDAYKPLPYFTIMSEHFGRILRMIELKSEPKIRINLDTEFYNEPENNVNIIGEISGTDPKLKSETVMIGAHFDSWHAGTGATDNGANSIVLVEALRILKAIGFRPKRTIRVGLWGGEEQAFIGSVAYAKEHFGNLNEDPNKESKNVTAYLNLDNGVGIIRGIYLQENEFARPVFNEIFSSLATSKSWALSIENTLSTDHETFDYYNIPSFQFIQDHASNYATGHTQIDLLEYVPEEDIMKNAVTIAWTIYYLSEMKEKVPRKK